MSSIKYVNDQENSRMGTYVEQTSPSRDLLSNTSPTKIKTVQSLNIQEIPAQLSAEILGFSLSYSSILEIFTLILSIATYIPVFTLA